MSPVVQEQDSDLKEERWGEVSGRELKFLRRFVRMCRICLLSSLSYSVGRNMSRLGYARAAPGFENNVSAWGGSEGVHERAC